MARTVDEIRASRPQIDRAKLQATTEADIRRHMAEDDSEPAAPLSEFVKRRPGERGPGKKPTKVQMTLRLDSAAYEAWKRSGDGYLTRAAELLAREAPRVAGQIRDGGELAARTTTGVRRSVHTGEFVGRKAAAKAKTVVMETKAALPKKSTATKVTIGRSKTANSLRRPGKSVA